MRCILFLGFLLYVCLVGKEEKLLAWKNFPIRCHYTGSKYSRGEGDNFSSECFAMDFQKIDVEID
jgi:hypothetical protein